MSCDFLTTKGILRKMGGDKISGKVLTWDGDKSNEIELPDGTFIKRIADFVDMTKVESVTAEASGAGIITFSKSQLTVNTIGDGDLIQYSLLASDVPMLLSFNVGLEGVEAGTYVVSTGTNFRFISATMSDTIVPIEPKYLPGVCLPVVELSTVASDTQTNLTAEEAEKIKALNGAPCIIKCNISVGGMQISGAAQMSAMELGDGVYTYGCYLGFAMLSVNNESGEWAIQFS